MDWLKKHASKLLLVCLLIVTYFMLCYQHEYSSMSQSVTNLYNEKHQLEQEIEEKDLKIQNLSKNFKSMFDYANDRRYNQGRGIGASYDLQYQGLPIEKVAESTELKYIFIEY